jgi:hypothetical protein
MRTRKWVNKQMVRQRLKARLDQRIEQLSLELTSDQRSKLFDDLSEATAGFVGAIIGVFLTGVRWVLILLPYLISILAAMAGLLHDGVVAHLLAATATVFMVYAIINEISTLLEFKIESTFDDALASLERI